MGQTQEPKGHNVEAMSNRYVPMSSQRSKRGSLPVNNVSQYGSENRS